jgi:glycosyltransferase involved in cell wall biosynthesis
MASSPRDVVWFAEIKWDYLRTRKQQIIRRKPDGVRLLYLEPYLRGRENLGLRRVDEVGGMWCATVPFLKAIPGGLLRRVADAAPARAVVDAMALSRARRVAARAGFEPAAAAAVTSNVYAAAVVARFGGRFVAYDCNDAHSEFPGMPEWTRGYFERSCRDADIVVATSAALREDITALRGERDIVFLGNGVDVEHFRAERERMGPAPRPSPPCVGYLGAIAPWFDFDAVERLARARPHWRVHLIGPVLPGANESVERLAALENVRVDGPVAYERVPEVLRTFTVGLIPFRYDRLTRAVNPNKMYEYLAMGVPVVATRFSAEVQRYPGLVTAVADAEEMVVACEQFVAMAEDPARLASFRQDAHAVASENDWGVIAAKFWELIDEGFERFM